MCLCDAAPSCAVQHECVEGAVTLSRGVSALVCCCAALRFEGCGRPCFAALRFFKGVDTLVSQRRYTPPARVFRRYVTKLI